MWTLINVSDWTPVWCETGDSEKTNGAEEQGWLLESSEMETAAMLKLFALQHLWLWWRCWSFWACYMDWRLLPLMLAMLFYKCRTWQLSWSRSLFGHFKRRTWRWDALLDLEEVSSRTKSSGIWVEPILHGSLWALWLHQFSRNNLQAQRGDGIHFSAHWRCVGGWYQGVHQ